MRRWLLLISLSLTLCHAGAKPWTWIDEKRHVRTREELDVILQVHRNSKDKWVDLRGAELQGAPLYFADLSYADLSAVNLTGAILYSANLSRTNLFGAVMSGANLMKAGLSGVRLLRANLSHADLAYANFSGAVLESCVLTGSNLDFANLSDADLVNADLSGTLLIRTDLGTADLRYADLSGSVYEPARAPIPLNLAHAELGWLTWRNDSKPIFELRKSMSDSGFRTEARQITAAIHRHGQSLLERVCFDWTSEWGANWLRPLRFIGLLSLICTVVYWIGIHRRGKAGLYLVATGQRVTTTKGKEHSARIRVSFSPTWSFQNIVIHEFRAFGTAFLFSLTSMFNIGFREFNFGRWVRMIQPREFDIRARGWMRTVSGVQSLIGVALAALSLLSYFGSPFD